MERAVAVVRFLQASGIDPRRLGAAGYSEFHPRAEGRSDGSSSMACAERSASE